MSDQGDDLAFLDAQAADTEAARAALAEQLAAYKEEQGQLSETLNDLLGTRQQVQGQAVQLQGDIGSLRDEQKLAADAARTATAELATAGGGDFYSPDVGQRIAPDGTVTYDFDAHLHARGIDLDAIYAAVDSQIRWLRTSDGAVIAQVDSFNTTNVQRNARLMGHATTTEQMVASMIAAHDTVAGQDATLNAQTGGGVTPNVFAAAGAVQRTILDANGNSDFARLVSPGKARLAFGQQDIFWTTAGAWSPFTTIQHGLGVAPTAILVSCTTRTDGGWAAMPTVNNQAIGASSFQVVVYSGGTSVAVGTAVGLNWLAIA